MASIMASTWIPGDQRKLSSLITSHLSGMGRAVACILCMMDSMILYNFGVQNRDTSSPKCNCIFTRKSQH
jgi:hypothetical protein